MSEKTRQISIFLLKEDVKKWEDALAQKEPGDGKTATPPQKYELVEDARIDGALFIHSTPPHWPSWARWLSELTTEPLADMWVGSAAAVLFLASGEHRFAVTWGYGRFLLDLQKVESHFGLRATISAVKPDSLRSLDVQSFEELTVQTRRQLSKGSRLSAFGLDVQRDLLRAVTGEPADAVLGSRMSGADSLLLSGKFGMSAIPAKCRAAFEAYTSDEYRNRGFGWVDNLRPEKDKAIVAQLDELLVHALQQGDDAKCHLAPPETLDWHEPLSFRYPGDRVATDASLDLTLPDCLACLGGPQALTLDKLKKQHIRLFVGDSLVPRTRWSPYKCLVFETEFNGCTYALANGAWFRMSTDFVAEVDAAIGDLPRYQGVLPDACAEDNEDEYNKRVEAQRSDVLLMHKKDAPMTGQHGTVEVCDLYDCTGAFIHVKPWHCSATLSHLFSQGAVSAGLFKRDKQFRAHLRGHLEQKFPAAAADIPDGMPDVSNFTVVYAIIHKKACELPLCLPFFSRLNLRQALYRLEDLGYPCQLAPVNLVPKSDGCSQ